MIIREDNASSESVSVTFVLPPDVQARSAHLVGDMNNWDKGSTPMLFDERTQTWQIKVHLKKGRRIEFRYLVDGETWINDWHADEYAPNPFGGVNSVVVLS